MLVGHNPGLENLVEVLTRKRETLPTAALVKIALPIEDWEGLRAKTKGKIEEIWVPRELPD